MIFTKIVMEKITIIVIMKVALFKIPKPDSRRVKTFFHEQEKMMKKSIKCRL